MVSSSKCCLFCASTDPQKFAGTSGAGTELVDENGASVVIKEEELVRTFDWSTLVSSSPMSTVVSSSSSDKAYLVVDQLKVIFILRKLLDLPVENCAEYLQINEGVDNPVGWFSVCTSCIKIVEEGFNVYCKMARLQKTLTEIKNKLKSLILVDQTKRKKLRRSKKRNSMEESEMSIVCQKIRDYIFSESQPSNNGCAVEKSIKTRLCSKRKAPAEIVSTTLAPAKIIETTVEFSGDNELITLDSTHDHKENEIDFLVDDNDADSLPSYDSNNYYKELTVKTNLVSPKKKKLNLKRKHKKKFVDEKQKKLEPEPDKTEESLEKEHKTEEERDNKIKSETGKIKILKYLQNCSLCVATYFYKKNLRNHQKLHENNEGKPCPYCGWLCEEKGLRFHIGHRHKPKLKSRRNFVRTCHTKPKQLKYEYKHITRTDMPYYCDYCHMIFTSKRFVLKHISLYHPEAHSKVCKFCDSSEFETKQLLELHIGEDHPTESIVPTMIAAQDEPHICSYCSKQFPSKSNRDYHIAKFHKSKLLTCKICGYVGSKFATYIRHTKTKHENEKYLCEKCPKSFNTSTYLKDHMKMIHGLGLGVGTDPVFCTICNVKFVRIGLLKSHMKHVHQKIKQQYCEHCGKAFSRLGDLNKHILLHTAPREKQYKQGPFFCEFCQAKFNVRQGLYYHLKKLHSDKYAFKCENCDTGYASRNTLTQHQWKCKGTAHPPSLPSSSLATTAEVSTNLQNEKQTKQ